MREVWPNNQLLVARRKRQDDLTPREVRSAPVDERRTAPSSPLRSISTSPWLPLYLGLLSAALVSPALFMGFKLDDYQHRFCTLRSPGSEFLCPSVLSPFTVATGRPDLMHRAMDDGLAPFWAYEGLVVKLFRPLAGLTHLIDYRFFPNAPGLMHAENIAWFMAAVALATLFYRATMGVSAATAAAFAFAVDHVHGLPAGWIANRNGMMAACFGTAALLAYDRSTKTPATKTTLVGVGCLLLGFLSGEIALGAWAYLLAHALVLDRRAPMTRLKGLLPYAVLTVVWRVAYSAAGYGASGSGLYIDPLREPLAFLRVLPERVPLLLMGVFGLPPAEGAFFTIPELARIAITGASIFSVALVIAFWKLTRVDRMARFWAVGCMLSLLASCSAVPHNRLLFFPSLGGMGLLAVAIDAFTKNDSRLPSGIARGVSGVVVRLSGGLHAFVSPFLLPLAACTVALTHTIADRAIPSAMATMTDPAHQDLIMVSATDYYVSQYVRFIQRALHAPEPQRLRLLSVGSVAMKMQRIDAHTLDVAYDGGLTAAPQLRFYRNARHPMKAGDVVDLDGLHIVIRSVTSDGRPQRGHLHLHRWAGLAEASVGDLAERPLRTVHAAAEGRRNHEHPGGALGVRHRLRAARRVPAAVLAFRTMLVRPRRNRSTPMIRGLVRETTLSAITWSGRCSCKRGNATRRRSVPCPASRGSASTCSSSALAAPATSASPRWRSSPPSPTR